jgi:hypothetical protein
MTKPSPRRPAALGAATALMCLGLALSACASTGTTPTGGGDLSTVTPPATTAPPSTAPPSTAPPSTAASSAPANYFADGKAYDAWVLSINADGTLTVDLVHHLTGQDAKDYLTSHGQTIPPAGIPNDYINVDTSVHKNVAFSSSATVTTNPQGVAQPMTASKFLSTYLPANLAQPIAPADRDKYPGAAHFYGALYALTFQDDTIVGVDQVFEP